MTLGTRNHGALLLALLLSAATAAAQTQRPPIDLQGVRVVDLTHPFDEKTLYWPTSPTTFKLDRLSYGKTEAGFFYASNAFCTPEHGGTHLDAPIHFAAGKVPGLENVARLEELPATGAWVIALPMKIAGGSGGPVRIVALVPKTGS